MPIVNDFTTWQSYNPALGLLIGKFMVIEDTILSTYVSEDGDYSGPESLVKISDNLYKTKGFAFKGNSKLSSWSVELIKV
ncbi:hypothetical protein [Desulfotruncus arcticus]|nr:hypothetical protein [Desulfotruncus arcticus]